MSDDEYDIEIYATDRGKEPFSDWLQGLRDAKAKRAIFLRVQRLKQGLFGDAKTLEGGIRELRIDLGPGYRVYFAKVKKRIILLIGGGDKHSQKKDIKQAITWLEDYRKHL